MEKEKNMWMVFLIAIVAVVGVVGIVSIAKMAQTTTPSDITTTEGLVGQAAKRCTTLWMESPYCNGKDVWQKWRNADCTVIAKLKSSCTYGCLSGACKPKPTCTAGWTNAPYCQNNNVYDTWKNADCTTIAKLKSSCTYGCLNGVCKPKPTCATGWMNTTFCKTVGLKSNVWDKWKNAGCTTTDKQKAVCTYGCLNGACKAAPTCTNKCTACSTCGGGAGCKTTGACIGFSDTCDETGNRSITTFSCADSNRDGCTECNSAVSGQACTRDTDGVSCGTGKTCVNGACKVAPTTTIPPTCTAGWLNSPYCQSNNVWDNWRATDCNITVKLKTTCSYGCLSGACKAAPTTTIPPTCTAGFIGAAYCKSGNLYRLYQNKDCTTTENYWSYCLNGCENDACKPCVEGWRNRATCNETSVMDTWITTSCDAQYMVKEACPGCCANAQCVSC